MSDNKAEGYPQYPHAVLVEQLHQCQHALRLLTRDRLASEWQPYKTKQYVLIKQDTQEAIAAALSGLREAQNDAE